MDQLIYFDNNATTQVDPRVLESMLPFFTSKYGNPSSTHKFGIKTKIEVDRAREDVADLIGAEANEIIFTSGSTEAINLALKGVTENYVLKGKHIVTLSTEHPAVLDTCKNLETKGFEVTYLPVESDGLVNLTNLKNALKEDTILVSIMYVNNETGVIQPLKEIAQLTHSHGAIFMTDATQAIGKIPCKVDEIGIDVLCMSGHKFYAPKGVGALFIRKRNNKIKINAIQHGGGHENGIRSGTLNVPGNIALGMACQIAKQNLKSDGERIRLLRDQLETGLLFIPGSFVNGNVKNRISNVSNICFKGYDATMIIDRLINIFVSSGSACSSALFEPSHVLTAMGLKTDDAFSSIRFSLGKFNTKEEVEIVIDRFKGLFL